MLKVRLFSIQFRSLWLALLLIAIALEILPVPSGPPLIFYGYLLASVLCFFALGFLPPLSFCRFNTMNGGVIIAGAAAVLIEMVEAFLQHGHSIHFVTLALKLVMLGAGFSFGIVTRYDRRIGSGRLSVLLREGRS